jgi:hypothetical protein
MNISIKRSSVFFSGLLLLLGSSMATAEQDGKNTGTGSNLSCKYTEVDFRGRPPFKRRTVYRDCAEQANPAHFKEVSTDTLNKQLRKHGHPSTRKR